MGHDIYFFDPDTKDHTAAVQMSYTYNCFYRTFNPTLHIGKKGSVMSELLPVAIAEMKRMYPSQTESKDPFKAVSGNYVQFLILLQKYASSHPTWIFQCD